jgi:glycosyltransferase involved in cell wall biosynthesis
MRPRLLVVASTYPARPGDGTPGFVRDLAIQEAVDFDVMVVVPRVAHGQQKESDGPLLVRRYAYWFAGSESLADGAIIENLRARPTRWLQVPTFFIAQYLAVRRAVRDFKPDVIHVHWIIPQGVIALFAARRVPKLVTTLGGDLYALNAAPFTAMKRRVIRGAGAVTVMNDEMAQRVRSLGASADRVQVMPMGADLTTIAGVVAEAGPRARTGPVRILFVGRLVEKKGLAVLLSALALLPPDLDFELTVVGDGPLRASLELAGAALPATFVGELGRIELVRHYASADIAVFPSVLAASGDKDGLPVALLEAMGTGCAIVASDLPGINEAIENGENGILVPPGDVARLASAVETLATDSARRAQLGASAAVTAARYSTESVGARYRALLGGLVRR